jgi:hypothetical protein
MYSEYVAQIKINALRFKLITPTAILVFNEATIAESNSMVVGYVLCAAIFVTTTLSFSIYFRKTSFL